MKNWYTQVVAKDAMTNEIKIWDGPYIKAPTQKIAQAYCNTHGMGYVRVTEHWVVEEINEETSVVTVPEGIGYECTK